MSIGLPCSVALSDGQLSPLRAQRPEALADRDEPRDEVGERRKVDTLLRSRARRKDRCPGAGVAEAACMPAGGLLGDVELGGRLARRCEDDGAAARPPLLRGALRDPVIEQPRRGPTENSGSPIEAATPGSLRSRAALTGSIASVRAVPAGAAGCTSLSGTIIGDLPGSDRRRRSRRAEASRIGGVALGCRRR